MVHVLSNSHGLKIISGSVWLLRHKQRQRLLISLHIGGLLLLVGRRRRKKWAESGVKLFLGDEFGLDLLDPGVEEREVADAAVNRVAVPRFRLERQRIGRYLLLRRAEVAEDLGGVARAELPVHAREPRGVIRRKMRREDASRGAPSPH